MDNATRKRLEAAGWRETKGRGWDWDVRRLVGPGPHAEIYIEAYRPFGSADYYAVNFTIDQQFAGQQLTALRAFIEAFEEEKG